MYTCAFEALFSEKTNVTEMYDEVCSHVRFPFSLENPSTYNKNGKTAAHNASAYMHMQPTML
jgi:hypothetical protein